jgi:hypothetical protein
LRFGASPLRGNVVVLPEPPLVGGFSERRIMLADQFLEAAGGARTDAALDELARKLWRAHAEGHLADADVEAISEAVEARRGALAGEVAPNPPKAVLAVERSKNTGIQGVGTLKKPRRASALDTDLRRALVE